MLIKKAQNDALLMSGMRISSRLQAGVCGLNDREQMCTCTELPQVRAGQVFAVGNRLEPKESMIPTELRGHKWHLLQQRC